MKKGVYFLALIFSVVLIAQMNFVLADSDSNNTLNSQQLQAAISNLQCKNALIISTINITGSDNLTSYSTKLTDDITQLQGYLASNDSNNFRDFVKNTYDSDYKDAREAVLSWRKDFKNNSTIKERKSLASEFSQASATFATCEKNSLKIYGQGRVTAFSSILDSYQNKADDLKQKGADTSGLNQIISDARKQIITPLQDALSSASDGKSMQTALKSYCLFNSCKDGVNFHLAAKFAIGTLNIAVNRLSNSANSTNYTTQINQIKSDITSANTALTSVGTNKYLPDQEKQVWDNIKLARDAIKQVISGGKNE